MFPPASATSSSSHVRPSVPGPPVSAPVPCGVPSFAPLRVRGGGGRRLRRAMGRQRRAMAAGLALTAAALAAAGLGGGEAPGGAGGAAGAGPGVKRRPVPLVSAPVRIADAATVRLLRPGDRVDVIAAGGAGADARVVAKGARVAAVPRAPAEGWAEDPAEGPAAGGALVVLSVPRSTAASLAGAGISGRLAVTLC
ncbi:RcpC/CpaB family pilus assembly protein [Streptomyces sp. NPDC051286]|uniref:RcpC/CpaB family pilus assembly protein n=1 Tax=Streptomyces sp. NPDC051286 TaxID=3365647 RepID=UPI0037997C02